MSKETAETVTLNVRGVSTEVMRRLSLHCGSHWPTLKYRQVVTQALTEYLDRKEAEAGPKR